MSLCSGRQWQLEAEAEAEAEKGGEKWRRSPDGPDWSGPPSLPPEGAQCPTHMDYRLWTNIAVDSYLFKNVSIYNCGLIVT